MQSFWSLTSIISTRRWQPRSVFDLTILDGRSGFLLFRASGEKAVEIFRGEPGGHRWQRVPPTEKRGRVQTSTITVAVLDEPKEHEIQINKEDLEERFTKGSGPGGQKRNKTDSAVILTHIPTGITVRSENGKSQHINRQTALQILRAKLKANEQSTSKEERDKVRQEQVGSGMRGDKIRTIQVRNNVVIDHRTGKRMSYKQYLRGNLEALR